jgi:hypothetical protein
MNLFTKIIEALHTSRRLQAEAVIRRYSHLLKEAHEHERRQRQETTEVRVPLALVRKTLPACATTCLALATTALINTTAMAADSGFATACALREIPVITAIEDHGAVQDIASDRLAYATFKMMAARRACYDGRVDAALRLYDEILNIELARANRK